MYVGRIRGWALVPWDREKDVEKGIAFVSYLSSLGRAHSTIKKKLSGLFKRSKPVPTMPAETRKSSLCLSERSL